MLLGRHGITFVLADHDTLYKCLVVFYKLLLLAGGDMLSFGDTWHLVVTDMLSLVIVLSLGHVLLPLGDTLSSGDNLLLCKCMRNR